MEYEITDNIMSYNNAKQCTTRQCIHTKETGHLNENQREILLFCLWCCHCHKMFWTSSIQFHWISSQFRYFFMIFFSSFLLIVSIVNVNFTWKIELFWGNDSLDFVIMKLISLIFIAYFSTFCSNRKSQIVSATKHSLTMIFFLVIKKKYSRKSLNILNV